MKSESSTWPPVGLNAHLYYKADVDTAQRLSMMYICGGVGDTLYARGNNVSTTRIIFGCEVSGFVEEDTLNLVETYNAVTNKCRMVGKLMHSVHSSGNCAPYRRTLYISGGADEYHSNVRNVQMFDTERNICTLLTTQMPRPPSSLDAICTLGEVCHFTWT